MLADTFRRVDRNGTTVPAFLPKGSDVLSRNLRNYCLVWFDSDKAHMTESGSSTEAEIDLGVARQQIDELSEVLPQVIAAFRRLDSDSRRKLFQTIATLFDLTSAGTFSPPRHSGEGLDMGVPPDRFSKERPVSAKEFLLKKQPSTDVERVACLAYYLTHYRDTPHFKTLDISKLNTEAAQVKFTNAAQAVNNATNYGYLAPATKGNKQLSAPGEQFVEYLPDREAARTAMELARPRRKPKRMGRNSSNTDQ